MNASDPYAILGLPRGFDLDRPRLEMAYLRRSADVHPDRCTDPTERAEAATRAAALNDARAILIDDERRANTLLALRGGPDASSEKTLPDGFLMEIMGVREDMDAALADDDGARERFQAWADERRAAYLTEIRILFEDDHDAPLAPDRATAIRIQLNALRYIERMIEQLDPDHVAVL